MARLIARLGGSSARHKWWVLAAWILVLLVTVTGAGTIAQQMSSTITISGVPSIQTLHTVDRRFAAGSGSAGNVVFAAPAGHRLTAADAATVATLSARLARVPGVAGAPDPFTAGTGTLSPDRRIGYIPISLASGPRSAGSSTTAGAATKRGIARAMAAARSDRLAVAATSGLVNAPSSSINPLVGLLIGLVILLVTFGSLLAAGLPLVTALLGLAISLTGISAATAFLPADSFTSSAPTLALLLALAVGIDYALFIVNRHRSQLLAGMPVAQSIPLAAGTAGSAVVFAGLTVVIALAGLSVVGIGFLTQMGLAAAAAVLVAMLMSVTLTPALLAVLGRRVLSRRARRRLAAGEAARPPRIAEGWVSAIRRHPALYLVAAVIAVGVLAVPVTAMRLGVPNDGSQPRSTTQRHAYDLMAEGFGPGTNGPILVLADFGRATPDRADLARLVADIKTTRDVARVVPSGLRGTSALLTVVPRSGPSDAATERLVHALRAPNFAANLRPAPTVRVTGQTAIAIDISHRLYAALPLYLGVIAGLAFVLLLIVFRSILIPLSATVSFLLSLGAALGGTVAVFQWGWLGGVFGVDPPGPLLCFLPIITIGVLFGLSMDYQMFLVSGMRERHARGATAPQAVTGGVRAGGRVVAAAATIMIGVFGNGVFTGDGTITPIAFSLAIGILVDAFLIRLTLVPALMFLFGRAAWWFPAWLRRATPYVDVEGTTLQPDRVSTG